MVLPDRNGVLQFSKNGIDYSMGFYECVHVRDQNGHIECIWLPIKKQPANCWLFFINLNF